jgi:putative nucleotidyltransferase with HDIG domain
MKIDLQQLILALSDTIDLVGIDEVWHGKRVAVMAKKCASILGLGWEREKKLFQMGLLHDCGISSTREHRKVTDEIEWQDASIHCKLGAKRVQTFKPFEFMADVIFHHHTTWPTLQKAGLAEDTELDASIIFLLDRVDALASKRSNGSYFDVKDEVIDKIRTLGKSYFHPEIIEVFMEASKHDDFWFSLEPIPLMEYFQRNVSQERPISISRDELRIMAELFAQIVDAKSPYTAKHSFGVSQLSGLLARKFDFDKNTIRKIEVAGLLHDLGKLQVPDAVLEKRGDLDLEDLSYMRHHSYVTFRILQKIQGLECVSVWAANHHEALDGSGYPFQKTGDQLDMESRIIIVSDIFQALAQNRPYRKAQPLEKIISVLLEGVSKGRLDGEVVDLVVENKEQCHKEATVLN